MFFFTTIYEKKFKLGNYKTAKQRAEDNEKSNLSLVFNERFHKKEEIRNMQMRPIEKLKVSPRSFQ